MDCEIIDIRSFFPTGRWCNALLARRCCGVGIFLSCSWNTLWRVALSHNSVRPHVEVLTSSCAACAGFDHLLSGFYYVSKSCSNVATRTRTSPQGSLSESPSTRAAVDYSLRPLVFSGNMQCR